jgi:hypothetical protein
MSLVVVETLVVAVAVSVLMVVVMVSVLMVVVMLLEPRSLKSDAFGVAQYASYDVRMASQRCYNSGRMVLEWCENRVHV